MTTTTTTPTPEHLPDAALEDAITTLAANIAAATARWLGLVAEFDRRETWGREGARSCAHWLNWKCGVALGAAREKVRVARALEALPRISAAFGEGELSYSKVRAMTRIATPDNEDYLLMIARHGTAAHVERAVRACRRVDRLEAAARANIAHATRSCTWYYDDDDGMLVLKVRLPAETGAALVEALAAAAEDLHRDVPAGTPAEGETPEDPIAARRADALGHLAEQFLARGPVHGPAAERHQIVVHVDRAALQSEGETSRCDIGDGPALAPDTARRLACDAAVIEIEEDADGEPLGIGRRTRSVPPVMRRWLRHRDHGCRFPGCTQSRYADAHHIHHWADGGETSTDNLVLLCRYHHRLVHEGGFRIAREKGDRPRFPAVSRGKRGTDHGFPPFHLGERGTDHGFPPFHLGVLESRATKTVVCPPFHSCF